MPQEPEGGTGVRGQLKDLDEAIFVSCRFLWPVSILGCCDVPGIKVFPVDRTFLSVFVTRHPVLLIAADSSFEDSPSDPFSKPHAQDRGGIGTLAGSGGPIVQLTSRTPERREATQ